MDVRSIRKTREAVTAPSCILLFDGLRVEFATTAASSTTAATSPSLSSSSTSSVSPTPLQRSAEGPSYPAAGAASCADSPAAVAAAAREATFPAPATVGTAAVEGPQGCAGGVSASPGGDSRGSAGAKARVLSPPSSFLSSIETVRVLSVAADGRHTNGQGDR